MTPPAGPCTSTSESLTGLVSNYYLLLFVRFCFGAGEAGAFPNASVVIGRWVPVRSRTRAWGVIWMTSQIGAALSPLLVVPIQIRYGWRAPFFVFGLLGVAWSIAWYAWFRDSPREKAGVSEAELREIGPVAPDQHHAVQWSLAFRSPVLWRIAAIAACYGYALNFFQAWLQTWLVKGRGFSEGDLMLSSLTYAVGAVANVLGGQAGDRMVARFGLTNGRRWVGIAGLVAAACFLIAAIFAPSRNFALAFLSLSYAGILFQQPSLCALCLDTGGRHAGSVFGFMNTAGNLVSALSALVFGYIVAWTGSYDAPFIPMVVLLGLGAFLWLRVDPTRELLLSTDAATPA